MNFNTTIDFLAKCLEGFFFGTQSAPASKLPTLPRFQESTRVYLLCTCNTMGPKKTLVKGIISCSMLSVCYIFYLRLPFLWISPFFLFQRYVRVILFNFVLMSCADFDSDSVE